MTRRQLVLAAGASIAAAVLGAGVGAFAVSGYRHVIGSRMPRGRYVAGETDPPSSADAVVIGGGLAGIVAALSLRDRGMNVVLCEKGYIAGEQSSRAYGWVVTNTWHPDKVPLADRGKTLWQNMSARLGADVGYRQSGNLTLLSSDEEIAQAESWIKAAREVVPTLNAEILSGADLNARFSAGRIRYKAALYQASDGTAEPSYSPAVIAEGSKQAGVKILAPCAARAIETSAGAVSHVITESGPIQTKCAVVAGGAWSSLFCGNLGLYLPQLAVVTSSMQCVVAAAGPPGCGEGPDYSWRKQVDGDYQLIGTNLFALITRDSVRMLSDFLPMYRNGGLPVKLRFGADFFDSLRVSHQWSADEISPFERARVLSPDYDLEGLERSLQHIATDFPDFAHARVKERWGGLIDMTPDALPIVSDVPSIRGLYLCTGFSGCGFTMAPAGGELIAQIISGEKPLVDPINFRFARFSDGTRIFVRGWNSV
jgi:glycine/D-amino acid oxidase-like deaminating enzyme